MIKDVKIIPELLKKIVEHVKFDQNRKKHSIQQWKPINNNSIKTYEAIIMAC